MESKIISLQEVRQLMAGYIADGYEVVALHDYTHLDGRPLFCRIRLKRGSEKKIFPVHQDKQGSFVLKEPAFNRQKKPIYRLHELDARNDETVYIVEGETCADRLSGLGLIATTSGGSCSAKNANWTPLQGRTVVIWPDADPAGYSYAQQVTEALVKLNCTVQWVDVSNLNLKEGGDCVDWINANPQISAKDVAALPVCAPLGSVKNQTGNTVHMDYPRFELKDGGVFYCKDAQYSIWICSWLAVRALTRDGQSDNWGRVLELIDADEVKHQWTMPMELLTSGGEELCRELLRLGLRIAPGAAARKLLVEYITGFETSERARCVLSTGWNHDCFVLPRKVYGRTEEAVLLQTDVPIGMNYGVSGSVADWQDRISTKCLGNSRLIFSVSLALAPPLLRLAGAESGGFHLRGESSTGKSTALCAAASVWGGRDHVQSWRATDNGLEGLAAQHNDTLLVLDELSQIDPRFAGEVAYMLANGQGKARAGRSGAARQRYNWRLLFLSSGETSLSSHMLEAGRRAKAGQEIRMVDIPADCGCGMGVFEDVHGFGSPGVFADHLKVESGRYFGIAGDLFLEKLVIADELSLHTKIQNIQMDFMKRYPDVSHGQAQRVAQRFALVAAAGEIATDLGITGWTGGVAIAAAAKCFDAWMGLRDGNAASHEQEATLSQIRHFFQENAARFDAFGVDQNFVSRPIPSRCAGFRSAEGDFYVFPKTFSDEICNSTLANFEIS